MVSETDTGTLQRLLRGNHSLCQGLRAQGLWCSTNNTNGAMREKTRREGMSGGKKKRMERWEQTFKNTEDEKPSVIHLSALAWVLFHRGTDWVRTRVGPSWRRGESAQFVHACERDGERTRATHHGPEVWASLCQQGHRQLTLQTGSSVQRWRLTLKVKNIDMRKCVLNQRNRGFWPGKD